MNKAQKIKELCVKSFLIVFFISFVACVESVHLGSPEDINVVFEDVGQGHSAIIRMPRRPAILVDAGQGVGDSGGSRVSKKQEIIDSLKEHIEEARRATRDLKYDLLIMATHADKDHSDWISDIVTQLQEDIPRIRICSLFGGSPEDYLREEKKADESKARGGKAKDAKVEGAKAEEAKVKDAKAGEAKAEEVKISSKLDPALPFLRKSQAALFGGEAALFASEFNYDAGKVAHLFEPFLRDAKAPARIDILFMDRSIVRKDKKDKEIRDTNPSSLILKIRYGSKSLMILGDAPGDVVNRLFNQYVLTKREGDLKSDIVLLSHHGAKEKGTNSAPWLHYLDFQHAVISSGVHLTYKHPTALVLETLRTILGRKDLREEPHSVGAFGKVDPMFLEDGLLKITKQETLKSKRDKTKRVYTTYETALPLYTTAQNGTITFYWGPVADSPILKNIERKEVIFPKDLVEVPVAAGSKRSSKGAVAMAATAAMDTGDDDDNDDDDDDDDNDDNDDD